jgi:hypothetical protein
MANGGDQYIHQESSVRQGLDIRLPWPLKKQVSSRTTRRSKSWKLAVEQDSRR